MVYGGVTIGLYLRNKTWWTSFTVNGDRYRKPTGETEKRKA